MKAHAAAGDDARPADAAEHQRESEGQDHDGRVPTGRDSSALWALASRADQPLGQVQLERGRRWSWGDRRQLGRLEHWRSKASEPEGRADGDESPPGNRGSEHRCAREKGPSRAGYLY